MTIADLRLACVHVRSHPRQLTINYALLGACIRFRRECAADMLAADTARRHAE